MIKGNKSKWNRNLTFKILKIEKIVLHLFEL